MTVELTIRGDVEVLRLQAGDTIVITLERSLTADKVKVLYEQVRERFPEHEVVVCNGVKLSVQRAA